MMQKDPKDLFADIGHFLTPDPIRTGLVNVSNEVQGLVLLRWCGIAEVGQDPLGTGCCILITTSGRKLRKQKVYDDPAGGELAWPLLFLVEEHFQ